MMHTDVILPNRKTTTASFAQNDWVNFRNYTRDYYENEHVPLSWKQILQKHLLYKKPHLVFGADTREDFYKQLFMVAANFKVGKHEYLVRWPMEVFDRETNQYV